jgi:hypothetical protein
MNEMTWLEKWEKEKAVHFSHCYQGEQEDSCKYGDENCPAKPFFWVNVNKRLMIAMGFHHVCVNTEGASHGDTMDLWYSPEETIPESVLRDKIVRDRDDCPRRSVSFPESLDDCMEWIAPRLFGKEIDFRVYTDDSYYFCQLYRRFTDEIVADSVVGMNRASLAFCWAVDKYFKEEK